MYRVASRAELDRKSTRLNSSHTVIYTLSLHDALPICRAGNITPIHNSIEIPFNVKRIFYLYDVPGGESRGARSEEHTSELQSHSDLHSFPTRRSSDLPGG